MRFLVYIALLISTASVAQDWEIQPTVGLRSGVDEMACCFDNGQVLAAIRETPGFVSDRFVPDSIFTLWSMNKGATYANLSRREILLFDQGFLEIGTACASDSILWFSAFKSEAGNSTLGIYSQNRKTGEIEAFEHNSSEFHCVHPWVDDEGRRMFFSSDRPGGKGGMDIWFCNWLGDDWSAPIAMPEINSDANELFPTYFKETLYFSTNRSGDRLDIWASERASQWQEATIMPSPFNSVADDYQLIFLDEVLGYVTSSRRGSDDVYSLRLIPENGQKLKVNGLLECLGTPIIDANIEIRNRYDEVVVDAKSDSTGTFDLGELALFETYRVKVSDVSPDVLDKSFLYFLDETGDRVRMFKLNSNGFFEFEFLPGDNLADLAKVDNDDQSVLTIPVTGQIYENEPGDVGANEEVYIMSDEGELLALAYTSNEGRFDIPELRPLSAYTFKMDDKGRDLKLVISDGLHEEVIPLEAGTAHYQRLTEEEAIQLVDEFNRPIAIRNDEIFIIRDIFYQFDSASLNVVAQQQLTQLSKIMTANPKIEIELSSHTDSRGTDEYNLELSNRRASIAKTFLSGRGIADARVVGIGYGESRLTNECNDVTECPEELHARNRRTEIRIKMNDSP